MESGGVSLPWIHKHLMVPWNYLGKGDCCGGFEAITDGYYCKICDFFVHKKCGDEASESMQHPSHSLHPLWLQSDLTLQIYHCNLCAREINNLFYRCEICDFNVDLYCAKYPEVIEVSETHHLNLTFHLSEVKHPLEYATMDAGERVSLPRIHKHFMLPGNDLRKGDCCGRSEAITDGYYCQICDFFVHKKCGDEASESIQHPSHSLHPLWLRRAPEYENCNLCGRSIVDLFYRCEICDFNVDLYCAKYLPPKVVDNLETHRHNLTLLKNWTDFDCGAKCGKTGYDEFSYKCLECDLAFHMDCVWHPSEVKHPAKVNHSHHSFHPLKLLTGQPPEYSDGKCRLCGRKIDDRLFYHCSSCKFTLDMRCVLKPPPQSLLDLKAHDHQLTLLPRLDSFTCNACGLKGDRSPYICVQCDFKIHQDCLALPRIININRHGHRICGKKVDWTCGGYSCQRCPGYVVHSKCATRNDVWNGKELEGVPEEVEDIEPYVVITTRIGQYSHNFFVTMIQNL